ncbi:MAG TPA: hypothetical protein VKE98_21705 [Gemmataceae bacterium]|nr:hypothetical protein [Gemmataceae bacterium]
MQQQTLLTATLALALAASTTAQDQAIPGIRAKQRLTILSANDGHVHARRDKEAKKSTLDSITVIHLGPDHPPIVKTVYGTVPNTISGPPYMAMTGDGRYGFVTSRKNKDDPDAPELISVIDLASDDLKVVQTVKLPDPRMALCIPTANGFSSPTTRASASSKCATAGLVSSRTTQLISVSWASTSARKATASSAMATRKRGAS